MTNFYESLTNKGFQKLNEFSPCLSPFLLVIYSKSKYILAQTKKVPYFSYR